MDVDKLLDCLKKILRSQNKTYRFLAAELGVSEPTVKRMFARKTVSLERFAEMCQVLGVTMLDVARMAEPHGSARDVHLSHSQEAFLCREERLFVLFNLLRKNWTVPRILEKFRFTEAELTRGLVQLDKERLIELHPGNKVRLLVHPQVEWLPDGPVRKMYEDQVREDFFKHPFQDKSDRLRFLTCEVSAPTLRIILKKMDRFSAEIADLIATDEQVSKKETQSTAFLIGARSWVFPTMTKYRTRS